MSQADYGLGDTPTYRCPHCNKLYYRPDPNACSTGQ